MEGSGEVVFNQIQLLLFEQLSTNLNKGVLCFNGLKSIVETINSFY